MTCAHPSVQAHPRLNGAVHDGARRRVACRRRQPRVLQQRGRRLHRRVGGYVDHRTATFSARRSGGSVAASTAESDTESMLRFLGWAFRYGNLADGTSLDITLLARADLGTLAQRFCDWLVDTQGVRFTTVCNYLSSLVSMTNFVYRELNVDDAVLNQDPNPIEQLVNLRDQAHAKVKEQNMYTPANVKGGHLTWPQAQETRVAAMTALNTLPAEATTAERRTALRNAALISLMTLIPPDRVGVIRRLRLKHTLQRRERREGGGWRLNLNLRKDGHKTSKHYGPFCAKLPSALDDILDRYAAFLEMEPDGDSAYLFGPRGKIDRPLEMSGYSQACKRAFQAHSRVGRRSRPSR